MAAASVMDGARPAPTPWLPALPDQSPAQQTPEQIWPTLTEPWCQDVQPVRPNSVVLINEADPHRFLTHLWSGLLANAAIILASPTWQQQEWQQIAPQFAPDIILGKAPPVTFSPNGPRPQPGQILIATGGTSGRIKFVIHTWSTLAVAAQGFLEHFHPNGPIN
ncbi:MAG: hypothetical protein AAFY17_00515, partial [Cyanobacteria bacterium J06642_11]